MAPRMGRPPKEETKDTTVRLRMTDDEVRLLDECVQRTQGTRSSVLLEGLKLLKSELDKQK